MITDQKPDKTFGERAVQEINQYQQEHNADVMEAIMWFCSQADIDPVDLVKKLPNQEVARVRAALIDGRYVRKKVAKPSSKLPIEK